MSISDTNDSVEIIQPQQFFQNRRSEARIRCAAEGIVYFAKSGQVHNCLIIDQSASGAKVGLSDVIADTSGDVWLIDLENHVAKQGVAAWANPISIGLRFRFVQPLKPLKSCPPRLPQDVYDLWRSRTDPKPPEEEFFLD